METVSGANTRRRVQDHAILLYFLITLCLAWRLLVPVYSFFRWDTLLYLWPLLREAKAHVLSGRMPFWTASLCGGTDLLANINLGLLYPLRALIWLLPLKAGFHSFLFVHVWLSLLGMHVLVRSGLKRSFFAAFVAALAYGAGGYARAMWDSTNFVALPWIPLGLAALLSARRPVRLVPAILGTGGAAAMLILGGDVQAAALWAPVALALALVLPERKRLLAAWAAGMALALLLTAPQWLPTLHAAAVSCRNGGLPFDEIVERSFHPLRLLELMVPHAFGTHGNWLAPSLMGSGATRLFPWVGSFHVGILTLIPVALAWRKRRLRPLYWAWGLFIVAVLLSFGRFLPGFQGWARLPLLRGFRYPEKYLLWATLALAVQAAYGAGTLRAVWRREVCRTVRVRIVLVWLTVIGGGTGIAFWSLHTVANPGFAAGAWFAARAASVAGVAALTVAAASLPRRYRGRLMLAALFLAGILIPWYTERPLTRDWAPSVPPPMARTIRESAQPFGRIAVDPALERTPLPDGWRRMPAPEQRAAHMAARLDYNSARMWGLRTVNGFSPLESGAMWRLRRPFCSPDAAPPAPEALARFCRITGVQWIFTTGARAAGLMQALPDARPVETWGDAAPVVLLQRPRVAEAWVAPPAAGDRAPVLKGLWRIRSNTMRVDLHPGAETVICVAETYAPGWRARDELGRPLQTFPVHSALLGVAAPAGTLQVRLTYEPPGWRRGLLGAAAGAVFAAGLLLYLARGAWRGYLAGLPCMLVTGLLVFSGLGLAARTHWGCTYDEGFHLTRGLGRLLRADSRLNYYHPPLQNMLCGWFAAQAHGDRLSFPDGAGWRQGDVQKASIDVTLANRDLFPALVQASRWGSLLFGLALTGVVIGWAYRAGGPPAGWLAAAGTGLNPNLLAHANLTTTDIGVSAAVVAASYLLWCSVQRRDLGLLFWAGMVFVAASLVKFAGLIWLGAFLFLVVPIESVRRRSLLPLAVIPAVLACGALLVLYLYTGDVQMVRGRGPDWLAGKSLVAGRFFEGLLRQGSHALEGHRSYFAGRQFIKGSWVHALLNFAVKTPPAWLVALPAALVWAVCLAWRRKACVIPLIPLLTFGVIFLVANRMALGIRHLLPFTAFAVLGVSVMVARIPRRWIRSAVAAGLLLASLSAAGGSYPDFISYFPLWAGGTGGGHRWAVDSNYDWGQDVEQLEREWGAMTRRNGGTPPHLLYFGFVDPRVVYRLTVCRPSWCGYMDGFARSRGPADTFGAWRASLEAIEGLTVSSVSMLRLKPFGIDLGYVEADEPVDKIGRTLFVIDCPRKE